jgi:hypothetical protein
MHTARDIYQAHADSIAPGQTRIGYTGGQWWIYVPTERGRLRGFAVGRGNSNRIMSAIALVIDTLSIDDDDDTAAA